LQGRISEIEEIHAPPMVTEWIRVKYSKIHQTASAVRKVRRSGEILEC